MLMMMMMMTTNIIAIVMHTFPCPFVIKCKLLLHVFQESSLVIASVLYCTPQKPLLIV